jgi:hypothetical protein
MVCRTNQEQLKNLQNTYTPTEVTPGSLRTGRSQLETAPDDLHWPDIDGDRTDTRTCKDPSSLPEFI